MEQFVLFPPDGPWGSGVLAYIACTILVTLYAWDRFNTPSSNRSSTLRALFWSNCIGYVISALLLFGGLSYLLHEPAWQRALGLSGQAALPAPLIATLALTTLLPSVPILKRLDSWLLSKFLGWAAIPAEARQLAAAMAPATFTVTVADWNSGSKASSGAPSPVLMAQADKAA